MAVGDSSDSIRGSGKGSGGRANAHCPKKHYSETETWKDLDKNVDGNATQRV